VKPSEVLFEILVDTNDILSLTLVLLLLLMEQDVLKQPRLIKRYITNIIPAPLVAPVVLLMLRIG
jgi:hypothetical protein